MKDSRCLPKIAGLARSQQAGHPGKASPQEGLKHALQQLMNLAAKLTAADEDGRLIIDPAQGFIKFVLLNSAARFCQVCSLHCTHSGCVNSAVWHRQRSACWICEALLH